MIEFRTLGQVDLRGPRSRPLGAVLRQPKCLALLAYLAMARPHGFHRRDSLLPLFWPELDDRHARAALNQALYRLRRALGQEALLTRGDEEVAVDRGRVWCDAAAFDEAAASGDHAAAVDLYQGEPLPGFILSDAAEFEQWLAAARTRLRALAGRSAWSRAAEEEALGNAEAAARLARRALEFSRDDEAEFRELLALLARTGDRAGALRAYDEFAARLRQDYEAEPDARTRAIVEALRGERMGGGVVMPAAAVVWQAARPVAPLPTPQVAHHPSAVPRSRRSVVALAAAVALVLATVWWIGSRGPGAGPSSGGAPPGVRVAVFPFAYQGGGSLAYLANGMPQVLGANLDGAGNLRSVDHRALLNAVGEAAPGEVDPAEAERIASRLGAGLIVLGDLVESGDRLRIAATLYHAAGAVAPERVTVDGAAADAFALVDRLSARLIAGRSAARGNNLARTAALTAGSLPALKAYLEGDAEYRAGRYHEAVRALDRAVTLDTAFALAHYRLSSAAHWVAGSDIAERAARAALRHQNRLSEGERLIVAAFDRYLAGDVIEAETLYLKALAIRPDDVEAWFNLAEVQFHWWAYFGRSALASRAAFERVLAYEPEHPGALLHLARIAATEGRRGELDTLTVRLSQLTLPAEQRVEINALRGVALGDRAALDRSLAALSGASDDVVEAVVRVVAVHGSDLAAAVRVARVQAAPARDPLTRGRAHIMLAQIELARGRWDAAQAELDLLEALQPGWALQYRAAFAAFPLLANRQDELGALREALERPASLQPAREAFPWAPREIAWWRRHYLAGLLSLRLDDAYGALRHAVELERPVDDAVETGFAQTIARTLRSGLARRQGQPSEALRLLDDPGIPPDSIRPNISSFPEADARFLKGELLRRLGRPREALRWYASFPDPAAYDLIYLAPSHLKRAQVHEQLREPAEARFHYSRVLDLWREADPAFRPWLDSARQGLRRLGG